jgi:hypothetical protein
MVLLAAGVLLCGSPASGAVLLVPDQYPTIQEAVDASSPSGGDEIVVAPGIYEEQVIITHDLTLTGAGAGLTVLRAPQYMEHVSRPPNFNPVVHAWSLLGQVTLRDLTIDGAGRGRPETRFTGVLFESCGGSVRGVEIENFHEPTVTNLNSGIGIYAFYQAGDGRDLLVEDVVIRNYQRSGFVCFGSGCDFDLRNVESIPAAETSVTIHNGFELLNGSSGSLSGCIARNCWYDGTYFPNATACSFLFYYAQQWSVTECLSDQGQSGIYALATDLQIANTTVAGCDEELDFGYGIVTTGLSPALTHTRVLAEPRPTDGIEPGPLTALGKSARIEGCRIAGAGRPGTLGVLAISGLGLNETVLEDCQVTDWDVGVFSFESSGLVSARARTCLIQDNLAQGIQAQTAEPFDARGNYWGHPSGPYHPETNPAGQGDTVSGTVVFNPWLKGNLVCAPLPRYIALADSTGSGYSGDLTVHYLGGESQPVYGFSAEITWNQEKLTAARTDFTRPDGGIFQSAVLFQVMAIENGFRVDAALGGDQAGLLTGELFKMRFTLVDDPPYVEVPVNLELRHLRDSQNQEIEGTITDDGLVIGDLAPPHFSLLKLTNTSLPHTNEYLKDGDLIHLEAGVSDDDPLFGRSSILGNFVYLFGSPGVERMPDSYEGGTAQWNELPALPYPADGQVPYQVVVTDPAGNTATADSVVIADNTPPLPVSGLTAVTGGDRVDLSWENPAVLDANLRQVIIRSARTGLYPFYDAPEPVYPDSPTDGEEVYTGLGDSAALIFPPDGSERDIISFQAFAVDEVGFVSSDAGGSRDRAANYFLADVTAGASAGYDHLTDIFDVTRLGDTFDLTLGEAGFNAECDVGPTDDGTSAGLPLPDGLIDLDDLMVFADRFDAYNHPAGKQGPRLPASSADLAWTRQSENLWVLELVAAEPGLKAFRLRADLPAGGTVAVSPGALLRDQPGPHFLHAAPTGLEACAALLGQGVGFVGTGELLRVTTSRPQASLDLEVEARSVANTVLDTDLAAGVLPAPVPAVFALHGNYPNPFNPSTTIAFDLPRAQPVRLVIYGLDGRQVRRLVDDSLPAGRHEVVWRGRDERKRAVAAGNYLYRIEAGPWSATGKLNLVK